MLTLRRQALIAGVSLLLSPVLPATGQQSISYNYCVACTNPQATYLCTVGPREPDPGARVWGAFCAERARADAGHQHCSAQPLSENCNATRAFVFRGPSADRQQAEALTSPEPERRANAAEQVWEQTVENMRAVGSGVREGADAVERGAGVIWDGMVGVVRGAGCVLTLGQSC